MKRKIYDELLSWKKDKQNTCLTIQGQRQVGKTYIVERFAEENYEHLVEINFAEMPEMEKAFERAVDVDSVIKELSIRLNGAVFEPGKTLMLLLALPLFIKASNNNRYNFFISFLLLMLSWRLSKHR